MDFSERMSIHQYTMSPRPVDETINAAARAGVRGIGAMSETLEAFGIDKAKKLLRDSGLKVTVYNTVRFGPYANGGKPRSVADNLPNLDDAAEMGADMVAVGAGGIGPDKDITSIRRRFIEGLAEIVPLAQERNLKVVLEPLHPIFVNNFSVINTIAQAMDMIESAGSHPSLGLVIDTYHVWWDPRLVEQLQRVRDRIFLVQVNDWLTQIVSPTRHERLLPGEGCIDFDRIMGCLKGYDGWYDVEANNDDLRPLPIDQLLDRIGQRFNETVASRF